METYYKSDKTGYYAATAVKNAFEITEGKTASEYPNDYRDWLNGLIASGKLHSIDKLDDAVIEDMARSRRCVAYMAYRDLHGCTLVEAKLHVDEKCSAHS